MFVVLYILTSPGKDNENILKRGYIDFSWVYKSFMVTTSSSQNLSGHVNFNFRTNVN